MNRTDESVKKVQQIATSNRCDNICKDCPLHTMCVAMPSVEKKKVALIWLG